MNKLETLPFEQPEESSIVEGKFSEIVELKEQGYVLKLLKEDSAREYLKAIGEDQSVIENPVELAGLVKKEMDLIDKSKSGIAEMVPPHQLVITGNSEEDFRIVTAMKKVEGKDFMSSSEMFTVANEPTEVQKELGELIKSSMGVFRESLEKGEPFYFPDLIQAHSDDFSVEFKNIMVGDVEGSDRRVWLVDAFPLLRAENAGTCFKAVSQHMEALEDLDSQIYEKWFTNNVDEIRSEVLKPENFENLKSYLAQNYKSHYKEEDILTIVNDKSQRGFDFYAFYQDEIWSKRTDIGWLRVKNEVSEDIKETYSLIKARLETNEKAVS